MTPTLTPVAAAALAFLPPAVADDIRPDLLDRARQRVVAYRRDNAKSAEQLVFDMTFRMLLLPDGDRSDTSHDLLGNIGWLFAAAFLVADAAYPGGELASRMHEALATVVGMCLADYTWCAADGAALAAAVPEAQALVNRRWTATRRVKPLADKLAEDIFYRRVSAGSLDRIGSAG